MQQNRVSAKRSRQKKKDLEKIYGGQINELSDENSFLKDQVMALRNRVGFLQKLLVIGIAKKAESGAEQK